MAYEIPIYKFLHWLANVHKDLISQEEPTPTQSKIKEVDLLIKALGNDFSVWLLVHINLLN